MRNPYRRRIKLIVEILSEVVKNRNITRDELVKLVKEYYEKTGLEPIRGRALPKDIYDKELASLYIVGKYGLGLDQDFPEMFSRLFNKEIMFERALKLIEEGRGDEARRVLEKLSPNGVVDSNTVARMLRVAFTKTILGFESEENFIKLLKKVKEVFGEEERTVRNYVRYYIAFRTAEAIAKGEIRNRIVKEAYKQALSARIGFVKAIPGDEYIKEIAVHVFKVPEHILTKILKLKELGGSET